jgi:hypothetical protein
MVIRFMRVSLDINRRGGAIKPIVMPMNKNPHKKPAG